MRPRTFSKNACVFFFDGFTSGLPSYLRRFCPRKSNPSSTWVIRVLSAESASPRSFKNPSTKGRTSFSSNSFESPVMMKSSAYRTRLTLGVHFLPSFHFCLGKCLASNCCSPSKVDRKSTRLNSSHLVISYAVFCLKKISLLLWRRLLRTRPARGGRGDARSSGRQRPVLNPCRSSPQSSLLRAFFFNDTATTEIYTLSLHDALPISSPASSKHTARHASHHGVQRHPRSEEHTSELQSPCNLVCRLLLAKKKAHVRRPVTFKLVLTVSTPEELRRRG